jgi:hypothetical protein
MESCGYLTWTAVGFAGVGIPTTVSRAPLPEGVAIRAFERGEPKERCMGPGQIHGKYSKALSGR